MQRSIARPSLIGLAMVNAVVKVKKATPLTDKVVKSLEKPDAGIIHTPSITLNLKT